MSIRKESLYVFVELVECRNVPARYSNAAFTDYI